MAAINSIILMLLAESFRCTIRYLIRILARPVFKEWLHQNGSLYVNFHPVGLLIEGHREQENTYNYLPISVLFNQ